MQRRSSDSPLSVAKFGSKTFLIAGVAVLALLLIPWLTLPYGHLDWTAYSQAYETPTPIPAALQEIGLELVAEGLTAPVALIPPEDGTGRLFIIDQVGTIWIMTPDGELLEEPFLDLSDQLVELMSDFDERGLLGLAFHPNFEQNGRFFVYYSAPLREEAPTDFNHTSHISEFTVSEDDPNVADPASERILLQVDQPQFNHDAGQIVIGPDGFLYIPLGDGGGADDVGTGHVEDWYETNEGGNGQDITQNLLGSILRIDVDVAPGSDAPYEIPDTNPFVGEEGLDEIWAYGFRNPFRISFDAGGENQLFVGDAGQNLWEEVDIATSGGNYGWNVKEGTHCFSTANPNESPADCPDVAPGDVPLIDPIIEYRNANAPDGIGFVVIGGQVYRGSALPAFAGDYIFGDWSAQSDAGDGRLFVAESPETEGELWSFQELQITNRPNGRLGAYLLSFGQDTDLELYVLTSETSGPTGDTGQVWKIVPPEQVVTPTPTMTVPPTDTPTPTVTPTPTFTPTPTPPPAPPAGRDTLTSRVFVDYRCNTFFKTGLDLPLMDVPVTITFPDGSQATRQTNRYGLVHFSGFDASGGVEVSAELPATHRGLEVTNCPASPTAVNVPADEFLFRYEFVQFRATFAGEAASP